MKKLSLFLLCLIMLFITSLNNIKEVKSEEYYAKSYVVLEKDSKRILEGKDYYSTQSVASISKLMTFYVAYKYSDLDSVIIVGEEIKTIVGSAVYLEEGEQITLYELLVALLLRSGNDAAVVIAKYVGTSIPKFVKLMNNEAKELGMNDTFFSNPHGLDEFDDGNISCAYDMALLLSHILTINKFLEIESMISYKSTNHGIWYNKNKLIKQYKNTTSCKTGFTRKARRTLVSSAEKDGVELIICTLNCSNDFNFHKSLYESYFETLSKKVLIKKGELIVDNYLFNIKEDLVYVMEKEKWKDYTIFYSLNSKELTLDVYLISNYENIYINSYKSQEIKAVKDNFINKIINKIKKLLQ